MWAVMTTKNEIYFYKEGYLRTSSSPYSLKDHNNVYTRLTNQCLQVKDKQTYGTHEEGNTLSFREFQEYLSSDEFKKEVPELAKYNISLDDHLIPRMQDIVIDTFCAVKTQVNPSHRKNHFELFGYDFMIDEDFRVWLIEVNSNPYIGTPSKYMKELVPNMVDEMLKLVLDPVYPPSQ